MTVEVTQDGVLYWPSYGCMVKPFSSNMKLWPSVTVAIQFQASKTITESFKLTKHLKNIGFKPQLSLKNRSISKE